jgi:NADPH:quinone reductase-like Zn-dependent oxidoreductase
MLTQPHWEIRMRDQALWYVAPGKAELREDSVAAPSQGGDMVRLKSLYGAISRGTERLIYSGRVPPDEFERMRAPFMAGTFPFPVKYGYATVGRIEEGPRKGEVAFALHPHQTGFVVPGVAAHQVPAQIPPQRAVLAANMETALNAVWDGAPGAADRIVVVGGGIVGLLVSRLCARLPAAQVTVVDVVPARATLAQSLGARFALPDAVPRDCDVVFHASASGAGLATAIQCAGDEATIVELSWYGHGEIAVPLGGAFHSRRLRIVASQVGKVAPSHRPRWDYGRRLAAALSLLDDPVLDCLLAPSVPFEELPALLPTLLAADGDARCPLIRYRD